jgi:hypothetical protein
MSDDTPKKIEIPLTKGKVAIVDEIDADLAKYRWFYRFSTSTNGYAGSGRPGMHHMHRVILERMLGRPLEKGEVCDHIDRNSINNSRSNLRVATHSENVRNSGRRKPVLLSLFQQTTNASPPTSQPVNNTQD